MKTYHFDPNAPKPPSNAREIPLFEVVKIEKLKKETETDKTEKSK